MIDEELLLDEENNKEDLLKNIDTSMFSDEELLQQENIVEAILFMMGDSVSVDVLATALKKEHDIALAAAERLVQKYNTIYCDKGMKVIRINHKYQMVANNQYFQNLVLVASKPQKPVLTEAVLETLSIIAYKQPITKPEIEDIRGVKSDFAVNRLIEYGLVEEKGRLDAPGRPIILGTTEEFLLRFGLESTEDLPILPIAREEEIKDEVAKELQKAFGEHVDVNINDNLNDDNIDISAEKDYAQSNEREEINEENNFDDINQNEVDYNETLNDKENNINDEFINDTNSEKNQKIEDINFEINTNNDNLKDVEEINNDEYDILSEKQINNEKNKETNDGILIIDEMSQNQDIYKQEESEKTEEIDIVDYEDNNLKYDNKILYDKNINNDYENTNQNSQQHFDNHIDTQHDEKIDSDDKEPQ